MKTSRPFNYPVCPPRCRRQSKDKAGPNEIEKVSKKEEDGEIVYEAVVNKKQQGTGNRSEQGWEIPEILQRGQEERREERQILTDRWDITVGFAIKQPAAMCSLHNKL